MTREELLRLFIRNEITADELIDMVVEQREQIEEYKNDIRLMGIHIPEKTVVQKESKTNNKIIIYADGACSGNQYKENIGGWGAVIRYEDRQVELCDGVINTTNNAMELTAAIKALENIEPTNIPIEVNLDSAYVLNGITSWIDGWIKKGWKTASKKPVANKELWIRLNELKNKFDDISFFKVKGHSGDEGNELADELANRGMDKMR